MKVVGLCHRCGRPAILTCPMCGRVVCRVCFNAPSGKCLACEDKNESSFERKF